MCDFGRSEKMFPCESSRFCPCYGLSLLNFLNSPFILTLNFVSIFVLSLRILYGDLLSTVVLDFWSLTVLSVLVVGGLSFVRASIYKKRSKFYN